MRKFCLHIFFLLVFTVLPVNDLQAQYHLEGDDPAGTVWKKIQSDNFSIIYPQEVDSLARRYLFLFERNRNLTNAGLKINTPFMPIVIHPYNVNSNGVTYWAPRTIGIYSTPPFNYLTPQNWETILALHEGRHVSQTSHFRTGFYKFLYILGGEQTTGILNTSTTFNEGDAVLHETDFTEGGRGRNVEFLRAYRASFVTDAHVPHEQWRFGSFDRHVPDKYAFGYVILSGVRYNKRDYYAPAKFFEQYAKDWWRIFSGTNHSLKKASGGLTVRTNWNLMEARLTDLWKADDECRRPFSPNTELVSVRGKKYTEYLNPLRLSADSIVMTKSGVDCSRDLILVDSTGEQKVLTHFAPSTSSLIKDRSGKILFSEVVPDPRWSLRSYSVLREYDVKSGKFRNITHRTRFFNPALSFDEKSLYAVEYKVEGGSRIVRVDRSSGEVLERIDVPGGRQLSEIVPFEDKLFATLIGESGIEFCSYSAGQWNMIVKTTNTTIRHMRRYGLHEICFSCDLDGMDNIYLYNIESGVLEKITSSRFGAKSPTIDEQTKTLYYSDYDVGGYNPVSVPVDSLMRVLMRFDSQQKNFVAESLAEQAHRYVEVPTAQADSALFEKIRNAPSKRYSKAGNLFHIHSWFPCYPHMDRIKNLSLSDVLSLVDPGVTLISQNLLGSAVTQVGYSYSIKDKLHAGHVNFSYTGWYPAIEFQADINAHHRIRTSSDGRRYKIDTLSKPSLDFYLRLYLPLDFSKSGWNVGLVPSVQYNFSNDIYSTEEKSRFKEDMTFSLTYYRMLNMPSAKLTPRWGFGATVSMRGVTVPYDAPERMFYANLYGYLPGITKEHGIKWSLSYQQQNEKYYYGSISNLASVPRGYDKHRILMKYGKVTLDYAIPIYAIEGMRGWLGYVKRMEFIPFVDAALDDSVQIENGYIVKGGWEKMLSYGFDWLLDGNLFRMGMKLSVGFRYAHTITGINYMGILFNSKL